MKDSSPPKSELKAAEGSSVTQMGDASSLKEDASGSEDFDIRTLAAQAPVQLNLNTEVTTISKSPKTCTPAAPTASLEKNGQNSTDVAPAQPLPAPHEKKTASTSSNTGTETSPSGCITGSFSSGIRTSPFSTTIEAESSPESLEGIQPRALAQNMNARPAISNPYSQIPSSWSQKFEIVIIFEPDPQIPSSIPQDWFATLYFQAPTLYCAARDGLYWDKSFINPTGAYLPSRTGIYPDEQQSGWRYSTAFDFCNKKTGWHTLLGILRLVTRDPDKINGFNLDNNICQNHISAFQAWDPQGTALYNYSSRQPEKNYIGPFFYDHPLLGLWPVPCLGV